MGSMQRPVQMEESRVLALDGVEKTFKPYANDFLALGTCTGVQEERRCDACSKDIRQTV